MKRLLLMIFLSSTIMAFDMIHLPGFTACLDQDNPLKSMGYHNLVYSDATIYKLLSKKDAESKRLIAVCYLCEGFLERDRLKAISMLDELSRQGDDKSSLILASLLLEKQYKTYDCGKAYQILSGLYARGHQEAIPELAICYVLGLGTDKSPEQGLALLKNAMRDHEDARIYYLLLSLHGLIKEGSPQEAEEQLLTIVSKGNGKALWILSRYYHEKCRSDDIRRLLKPWAEQGNTMAEANFALINLFFDPNNKDPNNSQYYDMLHKAADVGNDDALFYIGAMDTGLYDHNKNPVVLQKAIIALKKSAKNQFIKSINLLAEIYFFLSPASLTEDEKKDMLKTLHELAEANNSTAQKDIGLNLALNEKKEKEGFAWLLRAVDNEECDPSALSSLALFYEKGIGCEIDLEKALYWYQKADEAIYHQEDIERVQQKIAEQARDRQKEPKYTHQEK